MTVCAPFEEAKLDTSVSIKAKLAELQRSLSSLQKFLKIFFRD